VGTTATLLDNTFYSAGLAVAAASSSEPMGIALAVVHGLMLLAFPARSYGVTWLFSVVMIVPVLAVLVWLEPGLPVTLVLAANLVIMLVMSQATKVSRQDKLRQLQLEQALGAASKLADESVQAALTTTLLTLGHFLHELRNYQTAIAANLEYVEACGQLAQGPQEALEEAQEAQRGQATLLKRTIDELRNRSSEGSGTFLLRELVEESIATVEGARIEVAGSREFEVQGNAEHLRVVLLNLARNAVQAGAQRIQCVLRGEASGAAVQITVSDDGTGVLEEKRGRLFDSFALSNKPGGSGLGLYLTRRYVELLGGTIREGTTGPLPGATFVMTLPARAISDSTTPAPSDGTAES
jgi:signal transduction histidine kinase